MRVRIPIILVKYKIWHQLAYQSGGPKLVRTKKTSKKVKSQFEHKKWVSSQKLDSKVNISKTSVQRILRNDLDFQISKESIEYETGFKKKKHWKFFFQMKNIPIDYRICPHNLAKFTSLTNNTRCLICNSRSKNTYFRKKLEKQIKGN